MQKTKLLNYQNMKSHYPMAFNQQTPADKDKIIEEAKKTIVDMQKRLETETNPKIRARCEEIIRNQRELIEHARRDKKIISRNPFGELCDLKSGRCR